MQINFIESKEKKLQILKESSRSNHKDAVGMASSVASRIEG